MHVRGGAGPTCSATRSHWRSSPAGRGTPRGVSSLVLPGPLAVFQRLAQLFVEPSFLIHTIASTSRILVAVVLSLVIGGGLALLARAWPVLDWAINLGVLPVLNSFPSIGWAILAAIWFEPGSASIVFVQVVILVPFCLINVAEGLRQLDPELAEMGSSFTRNRRRVLLKVTAPLMMPYVIGALRIAYGIAWKISLVAELLGSSSGLGYLMLQAQGAADLTTVLAACLCVVIIFIVGERLVLDPLARSFAPREHASCRADSLGRYCGNLAEGVACFAASLTRSRRPGRVASCRPWNSTNRSGRGMRWRTGRFRRRHPRASAASWAIFHVRSTRIV